MERSAQRRRARLDSGQLMASLPKITTPMTTIFSMQLAEPQAADRYITFNQCTDASVLQAALHAPRDRAPTVDA